MILNDKSRELPVTIQLSFYKVFEELEKIAKDSDQKPATYAKALLKELEPYPLLREGFEDGSLIEKYREPIDKLMSHLFPSALTLNEIKGAVAPFNFVPFYTSQRFANIMKNAGDGFEVKLEGMDEDTMYIISCTVIMQAYYGYSMKVNKPFILEIPDKITDTLRYYRSAYNADLMEIVPTDRSNEITHDDYLELMDNFHNVKLWKKKFPPNSWVMRGMGIINLQDITIDKTLNSITSSLLEKSEGSFDELTRHLRELFNIEDLNVAYMGIENNKFIKPKEAEMINMLMADYDEAECDHILCSYNYKHIIKKGKPLAISDVDSYYEKAGNLMSKMLKAQGIQSYLISPLIYNDKFVGFLELGSPRKYELTTLSIELLKTIQPILSVAANRFHQEKVNQVEVVIQDKFTSIQPSVKWRFEEEARKFLLSEGKDEKPALKDIAFNDVYPLYGQLDIKDSSVIRNNAIRADLLTQLNAVNDIMQIAIKKEPLPIYDEIMFRIGNFKNDLNDGIKVVSEHLVLQFLNDELKPVFEHLKEKDQKIGKMIDEYESRLNQGVRMIYEKHRAFDESVATLNTTLTHLIDEKQKQAQSMFPHYYERFKTDGVEFNMFCQVSKSVCYRKYFQ